MDRAPPPDPGLDARVRAQAERLRDQLDALETAPPLAPDAAILQRVERAATDLRDALALLSAEDAARLTSAELGFMPGPALDAHVAGHREDWDGRLRRLAAGAAAARAWTGQAGLAAHREFLVRGYLRGFAHLWRERTGRPSDPDRGSPFFEFASRWLDHAGVEGDHEALLAAALGADWRQG